MAKRGKYAHLWRLLRDDTQVRLYGKSPWGKDVQLPAFAWPGGYPLEYETEQGNTLCSDCATDALRDKDESDKPFAYGTHDEGPTHYCDGCNHRITSAYGDPDASDEDNDAEDAIVCDCTNCRTYRAQHPS